MKVLTLAQFILACSLSAEPQVEDTLFRVVHATSKGHPHFLLTHEGHVYTPEDRARAKRTLQGVLDVPGARVHIGVASLTSQRLKTLRIEPHEALDPCTNIGIASLELESLLDASTRKSTQALHEALATYYAPNNSDGLEAISFGARVLVIKKVDVQKEAENDDPEPGPTFTLERSAFYEEGIPSPKEEPREPVPESQPARKEDEALDNKEPS